MMVFKNMKISINNNYFKLVINVKYKITNLID